MVNIKIIIRRLLTTSTRGVVFLSFLAQGDRSLSKKGMKCHVAEHACMEHPICHQIRWNHHWWPGQKRGSRCWRLKRPSTSSPLPLTGPSTGWGVETLVALVAIYYVFNIVYPLACGNTLLFLEEKLLDTKSSAKLLPSVQGRVSDIEQTV